MSGALAKITDHWTETVSGYILEQFKEASNWKAILKSVIDKYSYLEGEIWKLAPILDFKCRVKGERPTGALLDFIAGIMNVERKSGESDADFYSRFIIDIGSDNAGIPDNVIYNASILSGDPAPHYMDEAPATFFVYTGPRPKEPGSDEWEQGGRQLTRQQVKKLAPAGVLGLPGAAIKLADGSLLGSTDKKLILAVAPDTTEPFTITFGFITNDGDNIVTNGGDRIVGTSTA